MDPERELNDTTTHSRIVLLMCALVSAAIVFKFLLSLNVDNAGYFYDDQDYIIGRDFLNFWQYGQAFFDENRFLFYDPAAYNEHLDRFFGFDYPNQGWSYPPHLMLIAAPFGLLGYNSAYILFIVISLALIVVTARREFSSRTLFLTVVLSPLTIMVILSGQFAILIAFLVLGVFKIMDSRPVLCGLFLCLLTMKPQIGVLFPLYFLLTGRWNVLFIAGAMVSIFLGLSIVIFGLDPWQIYFVEKIPRQINILDVPNPYVQGWMPTLVMQLKLFGVSTAAAMKLQPFVAIAGVGLLIYVARRFTDPLVHIGTFIIVSILLTPYLLTYDLFILMWFVTLLTEQYRPKMLQRFAIVLLHLLPILGIMLSVTFGLGSYFILLIISLALLIWLQRIEKDQTPSVIT